MSVNLKQLESHLATRAYIEGYTPSQADVHVFQALPTSVDASQSPHTARWVKQIASYAAEHKNLPGSSKAGETFTAKVAAAEADDDDDEVDLFGDDDDEEANAEAERVKAERIAAYTAKKSTKPKVVAKSVVTLDIKPWDDETDMAELEKSVRAITKPGLLWGNSTLVPIGYGIKKLQMTLVVEDDLVSLDELQEQIADLDDYVQSSDVAAMQKL